MLGSGAEASIASIINTKNKKMISVNENYVSDGIIYDLNFLSCVSKNSVLLGSIDALTHCVESLYSFNKNDYLDFYSINSINHFLNKISLHKIINVKKIDKKYLLEFCILSFNGGLAQNNAGSGICHALAHAAEKITGCSHGTCISYFIQPTLKYISRDELKLSKKLNKKLSLYISKCLNHKKNISDFKKIKKIVLKESSFNNLIEEAKKDPCWRLYYKPVNVDILKNMIRSFDI